VGDQGDPSAAPGPPASWEGSLPGSTPPAPQPCRPPAIPFSALWLGTSPSAFVPVPRCSAAVPGCFTTSGGRRGAEAGIRAPVPTPGQPWEPQRRGTAPTELGTAPQRHPAPPARAAVTAPSVPHRHGQQLAAPREAGAHASPAPAAPAAPRGGSPALRGPRHTDHARAGSTGSRGQGCRGDGRSLFFCPSALSIPHSTSAVNHFLFRLTAEGL